MARTQGLQFVPVTPCRVMDTRANSGKTGAFGAPALAGSTSRSVPIPQSSCNIPATAQAYSLNVTVTPPGPLIYLTLWPTGLPQPLVSTLNSFDGRIVANAAIVPAGNNGAVSVFVSDTSDVIIDINGYFAPASTPNSLAFYPLAPCRVADTRGNGFTGQFGPPFIAGNASRDFSVPSSACNVPATAQAYSLNMTVVPHGPLIYLTTWPAGQTQPFVSTLNAIDGSVVANAAIVPAGNNGAVSVFVSDPSDAIIDINGYFAPPGAPGAEALFTVTPCRVVDTRANQGTSGQFGPPAMGAGTSRSFTFPASPTCSIPATAEAYSLNVTVVPPGPLTYLTIWPSGQTQPLVSTLNSFAGKVVANAAIVPAGTAPAAGAISVFVSDASDVILDINGYFGPTSGGTNPPTLMSFSPGSGPPGTVVTVNGSNFGTATPQVAMAKLGGGSVTASVTNSTATALTFVVPGGVATGPISVATSGGSASSATNFTVTPSTNFGLTVGPSTASLIQGQTVAFAIAALGTNGFNQLAQLAVSGVPAGITAAFAPTTITAGQTAVLTLTAPASQATGTAGLTISATAVIDGLTVTQSGAATLNVVAPTTSLIGRTVVSNSLETPLAGVTISALGKDGNGNSTGCTGHTTVSDASGNFALTNLPLQCTGPQLMGFDGTTATSPAGKYAGVNLVFTLASAQVTASPVLVHLPRIDNQETFLVHQNFGSDQNYSYSTIPGLAVTVYANTIFTMPDGTQPDPFPLAAVQVATDRLPDAKPNVPTMVRVFIVAFQPANATTSQPVAVYYPNTLNTAPGTDMALMTLDPTHGTMVPYGTGAVSADGSQIVPDADPAHAGHRYGLVHFDWHGPMPPPPPNTNPGGDGSGPDCGCDPVDIASGIDIIQNADLTIDGNRGRVQFVRTLRTATAGLTAGPLGIGGDFNYDLRLDTTAPNSAAKFNLVMPDGRRVPFVRQPDGTLIDSVNPAMAGAVLTTAPDNTGTLRYKNGLVYKFQAPTGLFGALLSSISDANGNTVSLTRNPNAQQQVAAITDPVGRQLLLTWDTVGNGRITAITDPIGRSVSYTYNAAGYLATFTDAAGGVWRYGYDASGNLTTVTDPTSAVVESNTFDSNGRITSQVQGDGSAIQLSYQLTNPLAGTSPVMATMVTDQLGHQTTYRFNPQGFVVQVIDPLGQARLFNRQPGTNLLLGLTGPGSCLNGCGDPARGDLTYTYDAAGNLLTEADSLGNTYTYTYDTTYNKVTSITDAAGGVTRFQYDSNGNLTATTDPRGNRTSIGIGPFGLPGSITDPANQTTQLQYDGSGNLAATQDPLGNTTAMRYDGASRMTAVTDARGGQLSRAFDALDRITRQTDAQGGISRYTYSAQGDLVTFTEPRGSQLAFTYDGLGRVIRRVDQLSRSETLGYDAAGNLISTTDRAGRTARYAYDPLDRVASETYSDATVTRSYDANGRLLQINDSQGGTFSFQYDSAGRMLQSVAPGGAVTYTRDPLGRMASRQVAGQSKVAYQYDAAGNLTQASMPQASVDLTYDARNSTASISRSNGVSSTFTYDALARVLSIAHQAGNNTLANFAYTYDAGGNRASAATNLAQALTTQSASATFDAADQMVSFGGRTFSYDADGNRLTDTGPGGTTTYAWDGRNRLKAISQPDGTLTSFLYDSGRYLTQQVVTAGASTTSTSYLIDEVSNVVAIYGSTGPLSLLTGDTVDSHLAVIAPSGQPQFALADGLGSVAGSTGSGATLTGSSDYEPFGQTTSAGSSYPAAFTGRIPVTSTIYYYRNRYYDSSVGRFLSEDPRGTVSGDSLYTYAFNDPVDLVDPYGTWPDFNPWDLLKLNPIDLIKQLTGLDDQQRLLQDELLINQAIAQITKDQQRLAQLQKKQDRHAKCPRHNPPLTKKEEQELLDLASKVALYLNNLQTLINDYNSVRPRTMNTNLPPYINNPFVPGR